MKTEEDKRMLALSYIVADLKEENMQTDRRLTTYKVLLRLLRRNNNN